MLVARMRTPASRSCAIASTASHLQNRHAKDTPGRCPNCLRIPRAHRAFKAEHAICTKRLRRAQYRPQIPRVLQSCQHHDQSCRLFVDPLAVPGDRSWSLGWQDMRPGPIRRFHQRGDRLWRLRCQCRVKQLTRHRQYFKALPAGSSFPTSAPTPAPQRHTARTDPPAAPPPKEWALRCPPTRSSLRPGLASARRNSFNRGFCALCTIRKGISANRLSLSRF